MLANIHQALVEIHGETEIIFVDDGSTDRARQKTRNYNGPFNVRLICGDDVFGLASAACTRTQPAQGELLMVMDEKRSR